MKVKKDEPDHNIEHDSIEYICKFINIIAHKSNAVVCEIYHSCYN